MQLSDVVLFNITAIVGLRWLTTAASQFGLASLVLWLIAMVVFFLPSAVAVRELADIDPGAGGIYRWVRRAFGPLHGFVAGWNVHRHADVDRAVPISGEISGLDDAGGDARSEELAVPGAVIFLDNVAGIAALQDGRNAVLDGAE